MARRTAIQTLDDITGEPAAETVRFSLDGVDYDIDLSGDNAAELRGALERYIAHGRRTGGRKRKPRLVTGSTPPRRRTARTKRPARTSTRNTPARNTPVRDTPAQPTPPRNTPEQPHGEASTLTVPQVPQVMFSAAST